MNKRLRENNLVFAMSIIKVNSTNFEQNYALALG